MNRHYTNEFKLQVIKDYYENDLGVRQTARKWGLPSKNYIIRWEAKLKDMDLIPKEWVKKPPLKAPVHINAYKDDPNPMITALKEENEFLRCQLDYYKELENLLNVKKK